MIELLKKYAKMKSTWVGLITVIATVTGVTIAPEKAAEIASAIAVLVGAGLTVYNENTK